MERTIWNSVLRTICMNKTGLLPWASPGRLPHTLLMRRMTPTILQASSWVLQSEGRYIADIPMQNSKRMLFVPSGVKFLFNFNFACGLCGLVYSKTIIGINNIESLCEICTFCCLNFAFLDCQVKNRWGGVAWIVAKLRDASWGWVIELRGGESGRARAHPPNHEVPAGQTYL